MGLGKNIAVMGLGTIIAQSINVLVQPVLTRIIPASELGIYSFIVSIASIIIPIASLKIDLLVVSEKDEEKAQYITDVCIIVNFALSLISLLVIALCNVILPNCVLFQYGAIIYFVPFLTLTNGLRFLFIGYNNRYKEYKLISKLGVIREVARAGMQVIAGLVGAGACGLLVGYGAAPLMGYRLQLKRYFEKRKSRARITADKIKEVLLVDGRKQILFIVPSQFVNSFSSSLITISITALFTAEALGYYSIGTRVLEIPIIFISANVSKVCFQRICEDIREERPVSRTLFKVTLVLAACSAVAFGVIYWIAPPVCEVVFGEGYSTAGVYIQCLCLMYATRLVSSSFAGLFTAFNKQGIELLLNILLVVFSAAAFIVAVSFSLPIESFLSVVGTGYMVVYVILLISVFSCARAFDKTLA